MLKRGQITVFIVVGIVILFLVMGVIFVKDFLLKWELEAADENKVPETTSIKMFVESCLKNSLLNGMQKVFSQGGYYEFPTDIDLFEFVERESVFKLPYYFKEGNINLPSKEFIEREVSKAALAVLPECINDFASFKKRGYLIDAREGEADVKFREEKVDVTLVYPLIITFGDKIITLTDFTASVPVDFLIKYESIKTYLDRQKEKPASFLISDWGFLSNYNYFQFQFQHPGEDGADVLFHLFFTEKINEKLLVYSFALHYNWPVLPPESKIATRTSELWIEPAVELDITSSAIFTYKVATAKKGLTFSDDFEWVNIDSNTGVLVFDPLQLQNDVYIGYITARDGRKQEMQFVKLKVNIKRPNYPSLKPIPKQIASVGKEFTYKLEVENPAGGTVVLTADNYLPEINPFTHKLKFTPTDIDKGIHVIKINVENEYGKTWQEMEVEVK